MSPLLHKVWLQKNQTKLVAAILSVLFVQLLMYTAKMPLFHEEPRRALVAQEMMTTGNYIAPTVYQQPYLKKPPLQNWLIVLFSLPLGHVTRVTARLVSIFFFVGLCFLVYRSLKPTGVEAALAGLLIIATNYLMLCEYGNKAEPEILLTFFTFAGFYSYIRNPVKWKNIWLSGMLIGAGILTKGTSPLFFYPGLILLAVRKAENRPRRLKMLGAHFAIALLLPLAWLTLYALNGNINELLRHYFSELSMHTTGTHPHFFRHLWEFLPKIFAVFLPWSILPLFAWKKNRMVSDFYRGSLYIAVISFLYFSLSPGGKDRYLMPAFPFMAIVLAHHIDLFRPLKAAVTKSSVFLMTLTLLIFSGFLFSQHLVGHSILFFLASLILFHFYRRPQNFLAFSLLFSAFLLFSYENGIYYNRAIRKFDFKTRTEKIWDGLNPTLPVVIGRNVQSLQYGFYFEKIYGKPVYTTSPAGPVRYYYLTKKVPRKDGDVYLILIDRSDRRSHATILFPPKHRREKTSRPEPDVWTTELQPANSQDNKAHFNSGKSEEPSFRSD